MPGLDAHIGRRLARHGPQSQQREVVEAHPHALAGLFAVQLHLPGLEAPENQGIHLVKVFVVQRQHVGVLQTGPGTVQVHPVGVGHQGGTGLFLLKAHLVVGKGLPLLQGAAEAGVGPQAEGHGLVPGVGHRHRGGKAGVGELLAHHQPEGIGIDRQSVAALPQLQLRPVLPLPGHRKLAGAGKAVAVHGDLFPLNVDLAVLQAAHNGEQQGIAPRPVGRISRPDIFQAVFVPIGHQLSAVSGHLCGPPAPFQFQFHHIRLLVLLPALYRPFSSNARLRCLTYGRFGDKIRETL